MAEPIGLTVGLLSLAGLFLALALTASTSTKPAKTAVMSSGPY